MRQRALQGRADWEQAEESRRNSIDQYLSRDQVPLWCDEGLFEVRILSVDAACRTTSAAALLMYAALRWVEVHGGRRIVALGRKEVVSVYRKAGLELAGRQITCGRVTFELMTAPVTHVRQRAEQLHRLLARLETSTDWQLGIPFRPVAV